MSSISENLRYLKARLMSMRSGAARRVDGGGPVRAGGEDTAGDPLYVLWREWRPGLRRAGRIALIGLAAFIALPYLLAILYSLFNPPISALMLRQTLAGGGVERRWTDLEDISRHLRQAVVTAEDSAFCDHWGVDWNAVEQAIEDAEEGDIPRGASTIPMQTAKNLFLWPEQNYLRKALELPLAYWTSLLWSKDRMLEIYLNIAEWGPGVFGAEAAARHHFGKSARDLSQWEAALLAASLPNPLRNRAGEPGPRLRNRAARIQARVAREGGNDRCILAGLR